jgi:hypothetical protein
MDTIPTGILFINQEDLNESGAFHSSGITFRRADAGNWCLLERYKKSDYSWLEDVMVNVPDPTISTYTCSPNRKWDKENENPMEHVRSARVRKYHLWEEDMSCPPTLDMVMPSYHKQYKVWQDILGQDNPWRVNQVFKELRFIEEIITQCFGISPYKAESLSIEEQQEMVAIWPFEGVPKVEPKIKESYVFPDTGAKDSKVNSFLLWAKPVILLES